MLSLVTGPIARVIVLLVGVAATVAGATIDDATVAAVARRRGLTQVAMVRRVDGPRDVERTDISIILDHHPASAGGQRDQSRSGLRSCSGIGPRDRLRLCT
jgi:hypothetical protein